MPATYATGARVRSLRGDRDGARELLAKGLSAAERLDLRRLAARLRNEQVRADFELGPGIADALPAPRTIRRNDGNVTTTDGFDEDSTIRLLLKAGEYERAVSTGRTPRRERRSGP
jgi:serine/threonine-protein kinase PknK